MLIELEARRRLRKEVKFELVCAGYDSATLHLRADGWYVEGYWIAKSLRILLASLQLAARVEDRA